MEVSKALKAADRLTTSAGDLLMQIKQPKADVRRSLSQVNKCPCELQ
jgi:hypothetical protein